MEPEVSLQPSNHIVEVLNGVAKQEDLDKQMFFTIESKNLTNLKTLCQTLQSINANIGLYFDGKKMLQNAFSVEEISNISLQTCGLLDIGPIQHAHFLEWEEGIQCLFDYNIGTVQGSGSSIVNRDRFLHYMKQRTISADQKDYMVSMTRHFLQQLLEMFPNQHMLKRAVPLFHLIVKNDPFLQQKLTALFLDMKSLQSTFTTKSQLIDHMCFLELFAVVELEKIWARANESQQQWIYDWIVSLMNAADSL